MKDRIPSEIADRCEFETKDEIVYVRRIRPVDPCECGETLTDTRILKINRTQFPFDHIREYCYICKRHRHSGGAWHSSVTELNAEMRSAAYPKKPTR